MPGKSSRFKFPEALRADRSWGFLHLLAGCLVTCLVACLVACLASSSAEAQGQLRNGFGARVGAGRITHTADPVILEAFYDVGMGDIWMTPELLYYAMPDYAYGFNLKFKVPLFRTGAVRWTGDAGIQFAVWKDVANSGIPLDLTARIPLAWPVELEGTLNYTPIFFLGGEPGRGLLSILVGLRVAIE